MPFKRRNPQSQFEGTGFTVTNTLFKAPALSFLPDIYQDAPSHRWAVSYRGADPAIFGYGDILACALVEHRAEASKREGRELLGQIISNPKEASRANAEANDNLCVGASLKIMVRSNRSEDGSAELEIPIITSPVRKSSVTYRQLMAYGAELRDEFLAMRERSSTGGAS